MVAAQAHHRRLTYISVEPFHLFRYLDEQAFRFNRRKVTDAERFFATLKSVVDRGVTYAELTGKLQETEGACAYHEGNGAENGEHVSGLDLQTGKIYHRRCAEDQTIQITIPCGPFAKRSNPNGSVSWALLGSYQKNTG